MTKTTTRKPTRKGSSFFAPMIPVKKRKEALRTLLLVCAVTIALQFVPYASYATYPLRLLVTFIHEGSHALVALLTGGRIDSIQIMPDGSGVTGTYGGIAPLIASAGYLGATFYGTALLVLLRRGVSGQVLLMTTGVIIGLLTLCFVRPWANLFGFGWGVAIGATLIAVALRLPRTAAYWGACFVGVQCVLNALIDLRTLLGLSIGSGTATDAMHMQQLTLIPAALWAIFWIGTAFALLWAALLRDTLRDARKLRLS